MPYCIRTRRPLRWFFSETSHDGVIKAGRYSELGSRRKRYWNFLEIAVNHAVTVCVRERTAHLSQDVRNPCRRLRPKFLNQRFEINSIQQLHYIVKNSILGDTEVVQFHRMRRPQ